MRFTVLIPTFDNGPTLRYAILSVLQQTERDLELFVVGDGAPPETHELVVELQRTDPRIRYFDNPKGARHGEAHRDAALCEATGDAVCYLSDDDVWLPHHLSTMGTMLVRGDFVHTMHVSVYPHNHIVAIPQFATDPAIRKRMLAERYNVFGLSFAGHTMEAYRRLPVAWSPAPAGIESDLFNWRKWMALPECRIVAHGAITALTLPSALRKWMPQPARVGELHYWWGLLAQQEVRDTLIEMFTSPLEAASQPADLLIARALARARRSGSIA